MKALGSPRVFFYELCYNKSIGIVDRSVIYLNYKNLSNKSKEELIKRLTDSYTESVEEQVNYESGAPLTSDFLNQIMGVKDRLDVLNDLDNLNKTYSGFASIYGFGDVYDFYLFALSQEDLQKSLTKAKDYSKLVQEERKVVRNGKEHIVTVWVKPNGEDDEETDSEGKEEGENKERQQGRRGRKRAKEMESEVSQDPPKDLKELDTKLINGNKPLKDGENYYLTVKDEEGNITGLVGYSEDEKYITMEFYRTDGKTSGVASKGLFELMKLAHEKGKSAKIEDEEEARPLFEKIGFTQKESSWVIEKEYLKEILGEEKEAEPETNKKEESEDE